MNDIYTDFIIDYAKNKDNYGKYKIIIYELQSLSCSDLGSFHNFVDSTAIELLYQNNSALRLADCPKNFEYNGSIKYRNFLNSIDLNFLFKNKDKLEEKHIKYIKYLIVDNKRKKDLIPLGINGIYESDSFICSILESKIKQRLILNIDKELQNYIPNIYLFHKDELSESNIKNLENRIRSHFGNYTEIIIKQEGNRGSGNHFITLYPNAKIFNEDMIKSLIHKSYLDSGLIMIEEISKIATLSKNNKNYASTYRAAAVYHKNNFFNAINIFREKSPKNEIDSHKSNTIDIFSLKKPISILRKPNEKNIENIINDLNSEKKYNYYESEIEKNKAYRNLNLMKCKPELYNIFKKIGDYLIYIHNDKIINDIYNKYLKNKESQIDKIYFSSELAKLSCLNILNSLILDRKKFVIAEFQRTNKIQSLINKNNFSFSNYLFYSKLNIH